ncbi:DMT family transporter [Kiloniella sp. EL199]|uniref:DMT family transporter n=1 Tax=Kiloniella sp. EL199 TaxID=2107581 RepID=UPI001C1FB221|nr:DMT family transporter [Kiloniella sp. EL199]
MFRSIVSSKAMSRIQANLVLLVAAAIWGSTFVVQHVSMDIIGPMSFTSTRFFLGFLVVLPLAIREWQKKKMTLKEKTHEVIAKKDLGLMIVIGVILFTATIIQQYGIIHTSVTNAGFLTALYVPMVPLLGLIIFRKKPHWITWIAIACSFSGTTLISGVDSSLQLGYGDALILTSTIFWGLHVLLVGLVAARTSMPLTLAAIQFAISAIIAAAFAVAMETLTLEILKAAFWFIAYAGVLSVGIAFTLQVVGQAHTQPADAALILSMETVFAAVAGAVILGERLEMTSMIGCALILSAILMVEVLPILIRKRRRFS